MPPRQQKQTNFHKNRHSTSAAFSGKKIYAGRAACFTNNAFNTMKTKQSSTQTRKTPQKKNKESRVEKPGQAENLTGIVAENVKRLRSDMDLSLDKLAGLSGVSKAMLSQIEQARSAPSINVLWKIARALDVPFAALISKRLDAPIQVVRRSEMKVLSSNKGSFLSKALFPLDIPRRVEFYELTIKGGTTERAVPHPPGTAENIVIAEGELEIEVAGQKTLLKEGDSIYFVADVPHVYKNDSGKDCRAFLVMTYAEKRV